MTSPPQPHRKVIVDDLDLGVNAALPIPDGKRKAANERQRKAAAEAEAYERRRIADRERIWGRP
jgi:hypothetical protein